MSKFKPGDLARVKKVTDPGFECWSGRTVIIVAQIPPMNVAEALPLAPPGMEFYHIEFIDGTPPPLPAHFAGYCAPDFILVPLDPPKGDYIPADVRRLFTPKTQPVKA